MVTGINYVSLTMPPKEYVIQNEPEYLARIVLHEMEGKQLPFLHLDFKIWTKTAYRKLLCSWKLFRATARGPFFAISNGEDDNKWRKFVERLGFSYFMNVDCPDGKNRRCFISRDTANG